MSNDIRPAAVDDLSAVESLVVAAYSHYVARIGRKPGPMLDDYASLIGKGYISVLERDGAIKGMVVLIPETDAMLLDNIAVAPSAQGMGLGRRLMEFAERTARDAGFGAIRLYTHALMTENIALYRRMGYAETHRGEDSGFLRVFMTKPLV